MAIPRPREQEAATQQSRTYLWEARSPPSPHPPLREDERRGRRKERQEREAGEEDRKSRKERERSINRDYFLKDNPLRKKRQESRGETRAEEPRVRGEVHPDTALQAQDT